MHMIAGCLNKHTCVNLALFFFPVWLYHRGEFVGSGLTGERRANVHGYAVTPEEIVVQLECATELYDHPTYGFPLEAGSFSTWPRVDVDFNKKS